MPLETRYVALSYVAGQMPVFRLSKENFESLQVEGCLAEIRSDLPRTINDAIDFTKSLGERYIWVDALCLVHDDVHDVSFGVEIMNSIYQGAYFVIIAAAGTDSNSPLISGQPECFLSSRITTQLNTVVHMAAVQGLDWHLEHSVYRTRGWTLQEEVLSYRAVIFVNNQLYFRCRCANWSQETAADLKLTWLDPGDNNVARTTTLQDGNQAAWRAYQNLLEDYSNRQLILDGDALRAASGILRVLTVGLDSWHLDGLPAYYLDLSLLWISTGGNMRRRPQFASYSWAGWAGGIKWPTENEAWAEESGEITRSTDNLRRWILEKTFVRWCCWDQGYSLETLFNNDYDKPSRFTRLVSEYAGSLPQHVIDGFEDQRFTENSVWSMCTGSSGFGMRPDFKDQGRCHPDGSPRIVTLFETELVNSQAEYDKFASRVVKPDDRTILYSAQRPTGCEKRMYRAHREDDDGNITGNRWAKNFIEYRSPDMLSTREIGEELEDFSEWKDKRYWCTQYGYNHELKEHNRPPLKMPDYPPYPLLHFHTISLKLRTGTPTGSSAHASGRVPGTPLLSEDGKLVGSLHLDNIAESAYAPGTEVELVLLSKCLLPTEGSTLPTNVERATENKAWDMFWVMHIVWKETAIAERRGIGQVLDVALTTACGAGPEDKYIMLA
ncbi:hypothetical protein CkaCkLH20_10128 [Colletotrichum karsti]|uniref:Heterokaryon incompatibility domain-containing protein n=1 Tax=Colletotrichum karsti TaxID=1095194 RepID=A0A9P6I1H4_9PEZI|nr:uncharacterized protein CkaCkLH20_10128 [Colletotrichum karsti]KAF9872301.1 hypothetical protein CkaCkLH20_10128 [Colletotrichum karsti]